MHADLDQERAHFLQNRETIRTQPLPQWRRTEALPIKRLPVDWVRYSTLNHRTKAEQRRVCRDLGNFDIFTDDPLGEMAQCEQEKLLKKHQGFEALKKDLQDRGQQEPAVVTAEGILANGNRRVAALRELFAEGNLNSKYVETFVLPSDATDDEIRLLETELQVSERFEEEYSYINKLLLIEELLETRNRDFALVAKLMRMQEKEVVREHEVLLQIHQLVDISGGKYLHVDFEENQAAFTELNDYVRSKPEDQARIARNIYFLGTLAGCKYRDLRNFRQVGAERYIEAELKHDHVLSRVVQAMPESPSPEVDDLDGLLEDVLGETRERPPLEKLLHCVAQNERTAVIELGDGIIVSVEQILTTAQQAITKAAHEAKADREEEDSVKAPTKRVGEALEKVVRAQNVLDRARTLDGWNEGDFIDAARQLKEAVDALLSQ